MIPSVNAMGGRGPLAAGSGCHRRGHHPASEVGRPPRSRLTEAMASRRPSAVRTRGRPVRWCGSPAVRWRAGCVGRSIVRVTASAALS